MKKLFMISISMFALAAACAVQDPVEDPATEEPSVAAVEKENPPVPPGLSCDDFDSYCTSSAECGEGYVCDFNAGHCGTNFFGTYPNCGATATCYPACQPLGGD